MAIGSLCVRSVVITIIAWRSDRCVYSLAAMRSLYIHVRLHRPSPSPCCSPRQSLPMSTPARYEPMPRHYCLGSTMKIVGRKCGLSPIEVKRVLDECLALVVKRSDQGLRITMPPELMSRLKSAPQHPRAPEDYRHHQEDPGAAGTRSSTIKSRRRPSKLPLQPRILAHSARASP